MATPAEDLARELAELRRRLEGLERSAATDLRSIDDGTQTVFDADGNPVVEIGLQEDGTYGVVGMNGGRVTADEAREGSITGAAILDGAVGPEKASFYGEIADAAQAAAAAQSSADTAAQDASEAQAQANAAKADAAEATSSAAAAQQDADAANQAALDALGVAQGKAEIVYSSTAPDGDPSIYWVNTATGRGSRWDGSDWIEIQDESVQDALSDAADAASKADAAATAASNAQTTADTAQTAADDAASAAASAQSAADSAQTTADAAQAAADAAQAQADAADAKADSASAAASTAQSAADAASSAAQSAQTTADNAASDAATAQDRADAAASAASAAQDAADAADAKALDAAGIAESKGKVYTQATEPAGDPNGLWIDTGNGNVAKTWDGSAWVATQDADVQAAADAAANADSKAAAAQSTADSAASAASTAQSKADAAAADAATAQGTADSAKTDAAQAQDAAEAADSAAQAAQSAANAAQSAADAAQGTADQARTDASNAQTAADNARTAADAAAQDALDAAGIARDKGTVYTQSTEPAADPNGLWIDTGNGNAPKTHNGTSWVLVQDAEIAAAADAAADAQASANSAQSSADTARARADAAQADASQAISDAATAQGAADGAQARADTAHALADSKVRSYFRSGDPRSAGLPVDVGDLWLDQGNGNVLKRWSGSTWTVVQDAAIQRALQDAADAQAAADGKITTFYGPPSNFSGGQPNAEGVGDLWVDPARGNLTLRFDGSGWVPLKVEKGAVGVGAITETEIEDDSISTPKIRVGAIEANRLASLLVLASRLVAGDPNAARAELSSAGFEAYDAAGRRTFLADSSGNVYVQGTVSSIDYVESESGWMLSDDQAQVENLNVIDALGADSVTAETITLAGEDLATDVLGSKTSGAHAYGQDWTGGNSIDTSDLRTVAVFNPGKVDPSRVYLLQWHFTLANGYSGSAISHFLTISRDGSEPNVTGEILPGAEFRQVLSGAFTGGTYGPTMSGWTIYRPGETNPKFALGIKALDGSGLSVKHNSQDTWTEVVMIDLGPQAEAPNGLSLRNQSGGGSGTVATATYTDTWAPTWGETYNGNGSKRGVNDLYQGYFSGTNGNQRSMVGYDDSNIRSTLSGASIKKVELTFRVKHSYYNAGLDVIVRGHNNSAPPNSWQSTGQIASKGSVAAGQTVTITLPNSFGEALRDGNARGIGFGPGPSTSRSYYGYLYPPGSGSAPKIKITYEK